MDLFLESDARMLVRDFVKLRADETLTILVDGPRRREGEALVRAAQEIGVRAVSIDMSQDVAALLLGDAFWTPPPPSIVAAVQASNVTIAVIDETYGFRLDHKVRGLFETGPTCSLYKVDLGHGHVAPDARRHRAGVEHRGQAPRCTGLCRPDPRHEPRRHRRHPLDQGPWLPPGRCRAGARPAVRDPDPALGRVQLGSGRRLRQRDDRDRRHHGGHGGAARRERARDVDDRRGPHRRCAGRPGCGRLPDALRRRRRGVTDRRARHRRQPARDLRHRDREGAVRDGAFRRRAERRVSGWRGAEHACTSTASCETPGWRQMAGC